MTQETFHQIDLGMSIAEVRTLSGEPYSVRTLSGNQEEYEYIERVKMGNQLLMEHHYFLTVSDGQVTSKRVVTQEPPPYKILYEADPNYPNQ